MILSRFCNCWRCVGNSLPRTNYAVKTSSNLLKCFGFHKGTQRKYTFSCRKYITVDKYLLAVAKYLSHWHGMAGVVMTQLVYTWVLCTRNVSDAQFNIWQWYFQDKDLTAGE